MSSDSEFKIGDTIRVFRTDKGGKRILDAYRKYMEPTEYTYRAIIVDLNIEKRYFRVIPIPQNNNQPLLSLSTRKAYKTKTYKL